MVYEKSRSFPKSELYGLTSQMRRAAYSAAANIVEGSARNGSREFSRFLNISFASLAELGYGFRLANDLGLLTPEDYEVLEDQRSDAAKQTWGLYNSIRNR